MNELKPFNKTATCPKCLNTAIGATYYPDPERVRRNCQQCGYAWNETAADFPQRIHGLNAEI